MKIVFNNVFGTLSQADIIYNIPSLVDVDASEHDEALSQGWLVTVDNGEKVWYQSRSTRVNVANTDYSLIDNYQITDIATSEMDHVYNAYCLKKGFKKMYALDDQLSWDIYVQYHNDDELVAWSKLRRYSPNSIETALFAWDYSEPHLRLGERTMQHEIAWAKQSGYSYVYMGSGYEKICTYKSRVDGFEWWTGQHWSTDVDHYVWLCKRDTKLLNSKVVDLHDLKIDQ